MPLSILFGGPGVKLVSRPRPSSEKGVVLGLGLNLLLTNAIQVERRGFDQHKYKRIYSSLQSIERLVSSTILALASWSSMSDLS